MSSRKPSLGFILVCVSLIMAAVGTILGLGISYLHEVAYEKRNLSSEFSSKVAEFAQRLTPELTTRLEREEETAIEEIDDFLGSLNYTLTSAGQARIKIYRKPDKSSRPLEILNRSTAEFESSDDTALAEILLDVITTGRPLVRGFTVEKESLRSATNNLLCPIQQFCRVRR